MYFIYTNSSPRNRFRLFHLWSDDDPSYLGLTIPSSLSKIVAAVVIKKGLEICFTFISEIEMIIYILVF